MNDSPTLVQFKSGWERFGTGEDGLPYYRASVLIRLDRPPTLSVERVAEEEDFATYPLQHQLFQKEQAARSQSYAEGYPLCMWPAVKEAEFRMLVARDVTTVEQLAKLHKRALGMPPELVELAARAQKLVELQSGAPKFEKLLSDRDGQIEALTEQVQAAAQTITSLQVMIDQLKIRSNA
jgi:hypothetical protein